MKKPNRFLLLSQSGSALLSAALLMAISTFTIWGLTELILNSTRLQATNEKSLQLTSFFSEISAQLNLPLEQCRAEPNIVIDKSVSQSSRHDASFKLVSRGMVLNSSRRKSNAEESQVEGWEILDLDVRDITGSVPAGAKGVLAANLTFSLQRIGGGPAILKKFPLKVEMLGAEITGCYGFGGYLTLQAYKDELKSLFDRIKNRFFRDINGTVNLCKGIGDSESFIDDKNNQYYTGIIAPRITAKNGAPLRVEIENPDDYSGEPIVLVDVDRAVKENDDKSAILNGWFVRDLMIRLPNATSTLAQTGQFIFSAERRTAKGDAYFVVNESGDDPNFSFIVGATLNVAQELISCTSGMEALKQKICVDAGGTYTVGSPGACSGI